MTLVIGYGNELRGDDAVGPRVAAAVNEWNLDGVIAQVVPQLTPELAEPISHAQLAVFVDAAAAPNTDEVQITRLDPSAPSDLDSHLGDPRALLALSRAVYGRCPTAWLITIPTLGFDFGAPLSALAGRGVQTALTAIKLGLNRRDTGSARAGLCIGLSRRVVGVHDHLLRAELLSRLPMNHILLSERTEKPRLLGFISSLLRNS